MKVIILIAMLFAVVSSQYITEGKFRITCVGSGNGKTNVLDVEKALDTAGTPIIVFPWHGGPNQQFIVKYVDGIWATLTAVNSGKSITVSGTMAEATYTQQPTTGNLNQQFKFTPTSDGLFTITNRASGIVMTCPDTVKTPINNFAAVQGSKTCNLNEKWDFKSL